MKQEWHEQFKKNLSSEDVKFIANMVKKDVLRTDRTHRFYAGSDDNKNVLALFNILVTYALTHPSVSYCQGMSDIASPILVVQKDEAQAYICFCAIMRRLKANFQIDGAVMSIKFQHLSELLQYQDPEFFNYLKNQSADDLLFTYRWLLLELKREFPFDDALYMLEVLWSSLPPDPPDSDLDLVEKAYSFRHLVQSPSSPPGHLPRQSSVYLRLRHLRRQATSPVSKDPPQVIIEESDDKGTANEKIKDELGSSSLSSNGTSHDAITPMDEEKFLEESHEYLTFEDSVTCSLMAKSSSIDRSLEEDPPKLSRQSAIDKDSSESSGIVKSTSEADKGEKSSGFFVKSHAASTASSAASRKSSPAELFSKFVRSSSVSLTPPTLRRKSEGATAKQRTRSLSHGESEETSSTSSSRNSPLKKLGFLNLSSPANSSASPKRSVNGAAQNSTTSRSRSQQTKPESSGKVNSSTLPSAEHDTNTSSVNGAQCSLLNGSDLVQNGSSSLKSSSDENNSPPASESSPSKLKAKSRPSNINIPNNVSNFNKVPNETEARQGPAESQSSSRNPAIDFVKVKDRLPKLPSPDEFGHGNPFLMFLCLTLLVQHRDHIMKNLLDYNDLAMHFDKMTRKHHVYKVLHQAQSLYTAYLKAQQSKMEESGETSSDYDVSV